MPTHWSDRDRKLDKRKGRMPVHGRSLKNVIIPTIAKKGRERTRAEKYLDEPVEIRQ